MWDVLITLGNLLVIPGLVSTALNKQAYVPRFTSGTGVVGLALVVTGLFGAGLIFSPIILLVIAALWVYIFLFRGQPIRTPIVEVTD